MAGEDIGRAEIEVTADTSHFPADAKRGVEQATSGVDPDLKKAGDEWGATISDSMGDRLEKDAKEVSDRFGRSLGREHVTQHVDIDYDYDYDHDTIKKAVRGVIHDLESEFTSESGNGGIFGGVGNKIGAAIADGIGAGFNVSGKSPLIALLIPLLGVIGALIGAAIEAAYGLGAALLTIPNILAGILIQFGVLALIVKEVGPAIGAAFAAKNAKELQEAIKGMTAPVQYFILQLLPLKQFFADISRSTAFEFFRELGNTVGRLYTILNGTIFNGLVNVARELGKWFSIVGQAFGQPIFKEFLFDLFNSIDHFISTNGPTFERFLERVFLFLDKLIKPAGEVGALFNIFLDKFGGVLAKLANDKGFEDFLDQMVITLLDAGDLIRALLELAITLFAAFNKGDSNGLIEFLTHFTDVLTVLFSSDAGIATVKVLIGLVEGLSLVFLGLVVAIISVVAFFNALGHLIVDVIGPAIGDFFSWIGDKLAEFWHWLNSTGDNANEVWAKIKNGISDAVGNVTDTIKSLPARLFNALGSLGDLLYQSGRNLITGLINGIGSKFGDLKNTMHNLVKDGIAAFLPGSPAKEGPLSGQGYSLYRGQRMMADFALGMTMGAPALSTASSEAMTNINFGPGAVSVGFYGQVPTEQQAQQTGESVGMGINSQLAARNARLAVRTR